MWNDMKIGKKLALSFSAICLSIVALLIATEILISGIIHKTELSRDESMKFALLAKEMQIHTIQVQQWLTDISATRAAEGYDDGFTEAASHAAAFNEGIGEFKTMFKAENSLDELRNLDEMEKDFSAFYEMGQRTAHTYINEGPEGGNQLMSEFDPLAQEIQNDLNAFVDSQTGELTSSLNAVVTASHRMSTIGLMAGAAALLLAVVFSVILTRSINRPLILLTHASQEIAAGNLKIEDINLNRNDEVGEMAKAFNQMLISLRGIGGHLTAVASGDLSQTSNQTGDLADALNEMVLNLRDLIRGIQEAAVQVTSSSEQLSSSAQDLSSASTEQASSLEETSASVEQLATTVQQNAEHAVETEKIAKSTADAIVETAKLAAEAADGCTSAVDLAREGGEVVNGMVKSMDEISASSKKIAEIIKVIDDIADQTNLLALNAAIEAARAGEMGKGFAVVAVEVRKLAERSQHAAKEISEMITETVRRIDDGVGLANHCGESLESIVLGITRASDTIRRVSESSQLQTDMIEQTVVLVQEISNACGEQASGANQIRQAITQLDQVTQQNSATSEESAAASEELSAQAQAMQETVSQFQINISGNGSNPSLNYDHRSDRAQPLSAGKHIGPKEVLGM